MPSNNVFQYSKIRTRKRTAKKSIKTGKKMESSSFWNPESSTRNPESTAWNSESKTVLDSLTWGESVIECARKLDNSFKNQLTSDRKLETKTEKEQI